MLSASVSDFLDSFDTQLSQIHESIHKAQLLTAHTALISLETALSSLLSPQSESSSTSDELEALYGARDQLYLHSGKFSRLKDDADRINQLLSHLHASDSALNGEVVDVRDAGGAWQRILREGVNESSLSVSYRRISTRIHEVRLEGLMHCDALHLIALLMEVDLYSYSSLYLLFIDYIDETQTSLLCRSWMPSLLGIGVRQSKALDLIQSSTSTPRPNYAESLRRVGHFEIALPWPLPNLDLCILGFGIDALADERALLLVLRDATAQDVHTLPLTPSSSRRIQLHAGGAVIEPIDAHSTRVSFSFNLDPGIDAIPEWLISLVLKSFAGMVWEHIASNARDISIHSNCEHARRMKEVSLDTYAFIRSRINESYLSR